MMNSKTCKKIFLSSFLCLFSCSHYHRAVTRIELKNPPILGRSPAGQEVRIGGFNSLYFLGAAEDGGFQFMASTDRGPTGDGYNGNRPFLLPDFSPHWVFLKVDKNLKTVEIEKMIHMHTAEGPITGLPTRPGFEDPVDVYDYLIGYDPQAMDPKGLTKGSDGQIWIADDSIPSLGEFTAEGLLVKKYVPEKELSKLFSQKRLNRGFSGISFFNQKIYAFLKSPLKSGSQDMKVPVAVIDAVSKKALKEKYYPLDSPQADQIGDVTALEDRGLLVLEKNDATNKEAYRKIFLAVDKGDGPLLKKDLLMDLLALGIDDVEKLEGLTIVNDRYLVLINDNDFDLRGRPAYLTTGLVPAKNENTYLYFIDLKSLKPKLLYPEE